MTEAELSQAERNGVAFDGGCPRCGTNDGYVNIGRSHWFYCADHKVMWCVGQNLYSSWKYQTESEQRKIYDDLGMSDYREITCVEAHSHPLVQQYERDLVEQLKSGSAEAIHAS